MCFIFHQLYIIKPSQIIRFPNKLDVITALKDLRKVVKNLHSFLTITKIDNGQILAIFHPLFPLSLKYICPVLYNIMYKNFLSISHFAIKTLFFSNLTFNNCLQKFINSPFDILLIR